MRAAKFAIVSKHSPCQVCDIGQRIEGLQLGACSLGGTEIEYHQPVFTGVNDLLDLTLQPRNARRRAAAHENRKLSPLA